MEAQLKEALENDDYKKAYEIYSSIYNQTKDVKALFNKCYFACFLLEDYYEETLNDIHVLMKHKLDSEKRKLVYLMAGRIYFILEDYIKADVYLTECEKYEFDNEQYGYILSLLASSNQMIFDKSNNEEYGLKALKYFRKTIEVDESVKVNCLKGIVDIEYKLEHIDEAYDALLELMKLGAKDGTLYYYLAHIKMKKEEYKDALYYLELAKQYDETLEVESNVAACYYHLGEVKKAENLLIDLINKNYDLDLLYQLVFMYFDSKDYETIRTTKIFDKALEENNDFKIEFTSLLAVCTDFETSLKSLEYAKEIFLADPSSHYYFLYCVFKAHCEEKKAIDIVLKRLEGENDRDLINLLNYTLYLLYRSLNNKEKRDEYISKTPHDYDYYMHLSTCYDLISENEKKFKKLISKSMLAKSTIFRINSSLYGYKYLKCKSPKAEFKTFKTKKKNTCGISLTARYYEFMGDIKTAVDKVASLYEMKVLNEDDLRSITDCNCYVAFYALYLLKGLVCDTKDVSLEKQYGLSKEIILHEIKKFKLQQHQNIAYIYAYFALMGEKLFELRYALMLLDRVEGENDIDLEVLYYKYNILDRLNTDGSLDKMVQEYKEKYEEIKKYAPTRIVKYYQEHEGENIIIPFLNNN